MSFCGYDVMSILHAPTRQGNVRDLGRVHGILREEALQWRDHGQSSPLCSQIPERSQDEPGEPLSDFSFSVSEKTSSSLGRITKVTNNTQTHQCVSASPHIHTSLEDHSQPQRIITVSAVVSDFIPTSLHYPYSHKAQKNPAFNADLALIGSLPLVISFHKTWALC